MDNVARNEWQDKRPLDGDTALYKMMQTQRAIMARKDLTASQKLVLFVMSVHANEEFGFEAWPSVSTLAEETSRSEPTVTAALTSLITKGLLVPLTSRKGGRGYDDVGRTTRYRFSAEFPIGGGAMPTIKASPGKGKVVPINSPRAESTPRPSCPIITTGSSPQINTNERAGARGSEKKPTSVPANKDGIAALVHSLCEMNEAKYQRPYPHRAAAAKAIAEHELLTRFSRAEVLGRYEGYLAAEDAWLCQQSHPIHTFAKQVERHHDAAADRRVEESRNAAVEAEAARCREFKAKLAALTPEQRRERAEYQAAVSAMAREVTAARPAGVCFKDEYDRRSALIPVPACVVALNAEFAS